ncbi:MAG TPA: hypothetical protein GYA08_04140 [Chloroflexi bacterium]|nr:hypothetical protein [Chloroflexota bacterium]
MSESTVLFVLCRVREGMRFGAQNQYGPGDVIELPVGVLTAFGDKLEQVMEAPAVEPEPDVAPEQVTKRQRRQQRDDV